MLCIDLPDCIDISQGRAGNHIFTIFFPFCARSIGRTSLFFSLKNSLSMFYGENRKVFRVEKKIAFGMIFSASTNTFAIE